MIKAEYRNNYKEYQKFGTFHIFIAGMKHLLMFSGMFLGLGLIFAVLAIFKSGTFSSGAVICFIFVFLLPILNWMKQKIRIKKTVKLNPNFADTQNSYIFNETDFNLKINVNKKEEKHTIKYAELYRVYETKTNFYLYLDKYRALIITKEGISEGTCEELSAIFQKALGEKFRLRNNKKEVK